VEISLFVLIFASLVGVLGLAYAHHFRYMALSMGGETLRRALARTLSDPDEKDAEDSMEDEAPAEEPSEEALKEALAELKWRIRRAISIAGALLLAAFAACLALFLSGFEYWGIGLAGVSALFACAVVSLVLLRDIPRALDREFE
jgi:hypothetical protein